MIKDENLPAAYVILRDYLKATLDGKIAAGGKECVVRCPFCGDSRDIKSKHLYIGVNRKLNNIIGYHCFKCNASGSVGLQLLRNLGIYDSDIVNTVLRYNSSLGSDIYAEARTGLARNFYSQVPETSIIPVRDTPEYLKKLDYINHRIGGSLTLQDLDRYKIILNLKDYLAINGVATYSRHENIMDQLAFGFIGFLSVDGTHITMRRLLPEEKVHESIRKRYTNYTINDDGTQVYCIRETIDTSQPNIICIAEGAFDILSIQYNMLRNVPNKVMFASCGKGLEGVIRYLVYKKRMDLFYSTIHIFIDNDITPQDFMGYKMLLNTIGVPYVFHRNGFAGEKDFGVPATNIIDTIIR